MTNLDKWRNWTRHLFSPDSFINFGWYYVVSAALQRRVWFGNIASDPLFPNLYVILIGDAGVGKGLVLGKVDELLRFHRAKQSDAYEDVANPKLLFPCGPNDCTYEKLCDKLAHSTSHHQYVNGEKKTSIYAFASMTFCLEELGSLFKRRHNDSMNKLLLQLYDCKNYDYETKHQGSAEIRKPSLGIFAGCVPSFLPEGIRQGILEDGTVSRMIFIYEWEPRMVKFFLGQANEEGLKYRDDLLQHVKNLSTLFGEVKLEAGLDSFLEEWYKVVWTKKASKCHPKMRTYYARSRVHVLKLAMAVHFSDSYDMILRKEDCETAIALLDAIEPNMQMCFAAAGRNENNKLSREVSRYIATQGSPWVDLADLMDYFQADCNLLELTGILEELKVMGKVCQNKDDDKQWGIR